MIPTTKMPRLLLTGFGPFGKIEANPSSILVKQSGANYRILRVSYAAVDEFLAGLDPSSFDHLLLTGVAAGRAQISLETLARNQKKAIADVDGVKPEEGKIDSTGPDVIEGTLWSKALLENASGDVHVSDGAGGYLCNYSYYRALQMFPTKRVGFLHVASFDNVSEGRQAVFLHKLIRASSAL